MSNGINSSQGWGLLRNLVSSMGGNTSEISNEDVQKILDKADTNNDDVVTEDEFVACFESSELYQSAEEQYLQAFKVISMVDGDASSMSAEDITSVIEAYEQLTAASAAGGAGGAGGTDTGNKTPSPTAPAATSPDAATDAPSTVDTSNIDPNSTLAQLMSQRADAILDLNTVKSENNQAVLDANSAVNSTRENYNAATQAFTDIISAKADGEQQLTECEQKVVDLQAEKDACNEQITAANERVNAADSAVSTISATLSSKKAAEPSKTKTITDPDTGESKTVDNPDYGAWQDAVLQLEAELDAANDDLEDANEALDELETSLDSIEADYDEAAAACMEQEGFMDSLTDEEKAVCQNVTAQAQALDKAQANQANVEAAYEQAIAEAQAKVDELDQAVAQKEAEEKGIEVPEGYDVDEDGNIRPVDKDGNFIEDADHSYGVQDTLPDGYTQDENGKIFDDKGNEIIVSGTDEKPQYLIKEETQEDLGFRERYDIAEDLYNNPDADWSQLEGLTTDDIKNIGSIYDKKVEDYNEELKASGTTTDSSDYKTGFSGSSKVGLESDAELLKDVEEALAYEEPNNSYADYLLEQGEWPLSEQEANDIAYELFDNPDAAWNTLLKDLTPAEIQQVESMYNVKVDDYYNKLLEADGKIMNYDVENFEYAVQDKIYATQDKDEILKALAMTPEEAQAASISDSGFADYMMTCEPPLDINNIPTSEVPEALAEILGEDSIQRKEGESDSDYMARIYDYINKLQVSEYNEETGFYESKYSNQEQIEMLTYIKDYGGTAALDAIKTSFDPMSLYNDAYNSSGLSDGLSPISEESVDTFLDIMEFNTETFGADSTAYSLVQGLYADDLNVILDSASSEQIEQLFDTVSVKDLAEQVQSSFSNGSETQLLKKLMNLSTGGSLAPENYPTTERCSELEDYKGSITKTLDALQNNQITEDEAKWILYQTYGSSDKMIEKFRDMTGGHQEDYLSPLYALYSTDSTST